MSHLVIIHSALAKTAQESNVVIVSPFDYDSSIAKNVREEMILNREVPRLLEAYIQKYSSFKSIATIGKEDIPTTLADLIVKGKIINVDGGDRTSRWLSMGFGGKAMIITELTMFNANGDELYSGFAAQNGGVDGGVFTTWSNKKQISRAAKVLPKKLYPVIIAGDLTTQEGLSRALQSQDPIAIRHAARQTLELQMENDEQLIKQFVTFVKTATTPNDLEENHYYTDAVAWGIKVISATGNQAYIPLLEKLRNNRHKKVAKYAKKQLKSLKKSQ